MTKRERERMVKILAGYFAYGFREWRKLPAVDRAAVSRRAGLYIGRLSYRPIPRRGRDA